MASHSDAMARAIERHRRSLAAVDRLSRNRATRSWTPRAVVVRLALVIGRILERSARRRLVHQMAFNSDMAEQKILYLVATTMAQKKELQPGEIAGIVTSVEDCRSDVINLLWGSQPLVPPDESALNRQLIRPHDLGEGGA